MEQRSNKNAVSRSTRDKNMGALRSVGRAKIFDRLVACPRFVQQERRSRMATVKFVNFVGFARTATGASINEQVIEI